MGSGFKATLPPSSFFLLPDFRRGQRRAGVGGLRGGIALVEGRGEGLCVGVFGIGGKGARDEVLGLLAVARFPARIGDLISLVGLGVGTQVGRGGELGGRFGPTAVVAVD